ncbi:LCP family protein [Micromonospora sp. MSM11]|nr:LCP family protein [Micromonospora sp. MSM11]MCL7460638.1 LCP family protein [Micromonospora sp. MSM11]
MIEDDLRAAFARHEVLTPPVGPLRSAIDRLAAARRRRRRRLQAGGAALALLGVLGIGVPHLMPDRVAGDATLLAEPAGPAPTGALNILLLGVDGAAERPYRLADSVLLVHIPADRSRPYLISLPRDLAVAIPGHGTDKLNAAFLHGAGEPRPDLTGGYELTRRVVTDLTGVRVDAGAVLTYPVLRRLTDEVRGVEVCLPREVRSVHTKRVFPSGCQRLDGAASVDLLRQRRGLPEGGPDRDRHAQLFAAGLIRQAGEQGVLTNPVRLLTLVDIVGADLMTDGEGRSLVDLLRVLPDLKSVDPVGLSLPVGPPDDLGWRLPPDPEHAPAFLAALREDRLAQWAARHPDRVNRTR